MSTPNKALKEFSDSKPKSPEAVVTIEVLDINFGQKSVLKPEIITLNSANKRVTIKVPFKEKLEFKFAKVEDDMIFKMAAEADADLIGFLYLEIPHKFKSLKEFTLDDHFPIKQLETDEVINKQRIFTARIKIDYKATRKLEINQMFQGKVPKQKILEEMAKSLRDRLKEIHKKIDLQTDEGFKYLKEFENTMMNRKNKIKEVEGQNIPVPKQNKYDADFKEHKNEFYRGATPDQKAKKDGTITASAAKAAMETNHAYEAVLKELTHTRKELIQTQQRIRALEEGRMTVDNEALKKKLESKFAELMIDKKELGLKLSDKGASFEAERVRLNKELEQEKERYENEIQETKERIDELQKRAENARTEIKTLDEKEQELFKHEEELKGQMSALLKREEELKKDENAIQEQFEENEEVRQRMVVERKKIYEEIEEHEFKKAELDRKIKQYEAKEKGIDQERIYFEEKLNKQRQKLQERHAQLKKRREEIEKAKAAVENSRNNLDLQMKELAEDKRGLKSEAVRVWKEKSKLAEDLKQFEEYKKVIEEDDVYAQKEFDDDYRFLDEQMSLLERGKGEMAVLKDALKKYEKYLEEEHTLQIENEDRFRAAQKMFFDKLKNSQFDLTELRAFSAKFFNEIQYLEQKMKEQENTQAEINRRKTQIRASIFTDTNDNRIEDIKARKSQVASARQSKIRMSVSIPNEIVAKTEAKFQAQFKADILIEKIFSKACLYYTKISNADKEALYDELVKDLATTETTLQEAQKLNKNLKLSLFVANKSANLDANARVNTQQAAKNPNLPENQTSLETNQQDTLDMFEMTLLQLKNSLGNAKDPKKVQERIVFVERCHKELDALFKNFKKLIQLNEGKDYREFDFMKVKKAFEAKIKFLMDYISQIRENYEFFNNEVDNEILSS